MTSVIAELKELLTISQVAKLFDLDILMHKGMCPVCKSTNSFKVTQDKMFICYKCPQVKGSIIDLLLVTNKASSVSEAIRLLQQHVKTSGTFNEYHRTKTIREKVFDVYLQSALNRKDEIKEYCSLRGWTKLPAIGYANSNDCLRKAGISEFELKEISLLNEDKEYYDNHLVFPVYDSLGNLKHFCGRALDERELRWKSSKGSPSIDRYFYNSSNLFRPSNDYLIVCEGISDCISLLQLGLPAISQFGIYVNLEVHSEYFKRFNYIVFIYDNDKYEIGSNRSGEYKSWSVTMPFVIDLACKIKKPIFYLKLPDKPGIKDINEWLLSIDYNESDFYHYIESNHLIAIEELAVEMYSDDIKQHKQLWRLLSATNNNELGSELLKDRGVSYLFELFNE